MFSPFKILVSIASVVVITAGGLYIAGEYSQYRADEDAKRSKAAAWAMIRRSETAAKDRAALENCRRDLEAYDTLNDSRPFFQRAARSGDGATGDTMLREVRACRDLVNASTGSE